MRIRFDIQAFFFVAVLLSACGDSPVNAVGKLVSKGSEKSSEKSIAEKISDDGKTIRTYSKMAEIAEKTLDRMQELSKIEPVSHASLKAWLPEQIENYKRTYYATGELATAGVVSAKSKFTNQEDEKKSVEVEVTDGAGPGLAGMFVSTLQRKLDTGMEEETENSYKRVVDRRGVKAIEEQNDLSKRSTIQYVVGDRFFISLTGKNMSATELWAIADGLHTDALPES